jgi:hypothetical protein
MPLNHPVLQYAHIIHPSKKEQFKFSNIKALVSSLLPFSSIDTEELESEFRDYLVTDFPKDCAPEVFWSDHTAAYPNLSRLMQAVMSVPHSNASSERIFSMLRKIHTDARGSLCRDTIRSLMTIKVNERDCCDGVSFTPNLLRDLKKAANQHNVKYNNLNQ